MSEQMKSFLESKKTMIKTEYEKIRVNQKIKAKVTKETLNNANLIIEEEELLKSNQDIVI